MCALKYPQVLILPSASVSEPNPVQKLEVFSTTTNAISVVWARVEGVPKYVVRVNSSKVPIDTASINNSMTIGNLMPSTLYNISVQSSTSDDTEGDAVWLQNCTGWYKHSIICYLFIFVYKFLKSMPTF